ncbi:MAG: 5'-nucleotidase [Cyanobacteriota bacterium]|nr:5'-nucleotidase [Cyanobacteriota bacterium]
MPESLAGQLVIAVSSRALFSLDESNRVFEDEGLSAYRRYQTDHENDRLQPGVAFPLIKRLLNLRDPVTEKALVEVILVSRNDADTGLRVFNSIESYGLPITRAAFTSGRSPFKYLTSFQADLFLSANPQDVQAALAQGHASAMLLNTPRLQDEDTQEEIRIAFDGDAVLFGDESERIYQEQGLSAFKQNEKDNSHIPLTPGPFKGFLQALQHIQKAYEPLAVQPIRTALVTARNAPTHKRVINTLRHWGIHLDEAYFLGGLSKKPILQQFRPHIFFDDQPLHCEAAAEIVPTGHVLSGIINSPLN